MYRYAANNPVKYTDPDGRILVPPTILIYAVYKSYKYIKDNMPSKEEHYARNKGNQDIGTDWKSAMAEVTSGNAIKMKDSKFPLFDKDRYHEQGIASDHNPAENDKFVSLDGKNESVYNSKTGQKITDHVNQGTLNFADPNKDPVNHFIKDMLPYYIWGNSPDDPTTMWERITGSYKGDVNASKEEAAKERDRKNKEILQRIQEQ